MQHPLPPLNALRAFEAAARLGSFKAAASELHVTHGAVSQHVRLLEEWLGAPLFERHNRRVVLTPAARAYLAEIGPAFEQVAAADIAIPCGRGGDLFERGSDFEQVAAATARYGYVGGGSPR